MVTLQGSTRFLCTPEEEEAWLKRSAEEIRKISLDTEIELLKPGSGRFTMDFCTLGMFIIDEIHFPPPKPPVKDVIGGAGAYAALGARLFVPHKKGHSVGWVVHVGTDFPEQVLDQIEAWGTDATFIDTPDRLTTRGWNKYGKNDHRVFKYLTPKIRVDHTVLSEQQLMAKSFHLICSPSRCIELVKGILEAREKLIAEGKTQLGNPENDRLWPMKPPIFVWEPVPDACVLSELPKFMEALKYVDVMSPNHEELASLFGEMGPDIFGASEIDRMEKQCNELLSRGLGKKPAAVVVRRGARGCYVAQNSRHVWFPAYHRPRDELTGKAKRRWKQKVVDPTGGGNAFLGGFCIGLLQVRPDRGRTQFEEGAIYGTVAASFAIEQIGIPELRQVGESGDERDIWNGDLAVRRVIAYEKRLKLSSRKTLPPLSGEELVRAAFYGPIKTKLLGHKAIRRGRIPADFDGKRQVPKD